MFAKVKGYPPWPARITGLGSKDRYKVYFYGTYETATLRSEDIWPYNADTKEKFASKNMKRKGYPEGIDQIENTPEIAPVEGEVDMNTTAEPESPLVINEPVKKAAGGSKPATPAAKVAPKAKETPKTAPAKTTVKRKASEAFDETPVKRVVDTPSTPANNDENGNGEQKLSRSGRAIKPKKFAGEVVGTPKSSSTPAAEADKENKNSAKKDPQNNKVSPAKDGEPRKMWVKVKDTDDLIEINLDKDRPESFESEEARMEWEMASARKALKFKKRVESGEFIPPEIKKKLEKKGKLTPEDQEKMMKEKSLEKK